MSIILPLVFIWLISTAVVAGLYRDVTWHRRHLTYAESFAIWVLWPILLPLWGAKGLVAVGRFSSDVAKELPNAVERWWKM